MSNRKRTAFTLKCKAKEAPALKKYRGDVLSFAKNIDDSDKHRSLIKTDILYSRKQRRKDERKLKKARKHAYRCGRVLPDMQTWTKSKEDAVKTDTKKKSLQKLKEKKKKQKARMKEVKKMKEKEEIDNRKQQLMEDNKKEDRMLKQLEKNLHLNKRKSKNLPQAFVNDGLDFLLDALDKSPEDMEEEDYSDEEEHKKRKDRDNEDSEQEMDSDLDEEEYMEDESDEGEEEDEEDYDFSDEDEESDSDDHHQTVDVISEKSADVKSILKSTSDDRLQKQVKFKTVTEENAVKKDKKKKESKKVKKKDVTFDDDDDDVDEAEEEDGSEEEKEGEKSDESSDENIEDTEVTEDIYGRLRDKEGNIVKSSGQSGKYIPPGKRMQISDEKKKFQLERLQKQLKGLVNRASEANMSQIFSQIEAVYRSNSRAEVTEALSAIVIGACVSVTMTPERLAMEMMLLITILHGNIGTEVGAMFLQTLAQKYKLVCNHGNRLEDKSLDNTVMLFGFLYTFKVVDSVLIFGIIEDLVKSFQEKDIQIILMLLKNVGFTLRKDNPNGLKEVILEIQSAAKSLEGEQSSHVKYMLEVIMAIKNNNMRKIPNYDPEHQEHLKKVARGILRGSTLGEGMLHISLKDLMNAEERGRWWLVGSAWEGPTEDTKPAVKMESIVGDVSAQLLELARKQRMNTDIRKNIFCIIMSSQDYIDAFDKLLRLGLKNQQEREIIHIIVDLCLQEKSFNPFYMLLLQKFCLYHRRFQMSTQFLMWDKFKDMKKLSQLQREHLSQLLSQLLSTKAMSLSVLKVVEFGTLGVHMLRFLKQLIQSVLLDNPEDVTKSVFQRIAPLSKLHHLHEGLKLFMQHFLLRKKSKDVRDTPLLRERIDMAVKVLSSSLHHSQSEFDD
ncbi:nucleolar MIF4G domain-containing protein 1-like [Saccostrea echinata]|uniref:nucleolar MIF4G domain-containing protein 1-like n=1 Tax=Saccostrea echinata TaxID=191078 RepID=UPI002A8393E8|nr:nucleolar MIF4G domain-containing protein 1-like [Saccostrea echinata]